MKKRSGKFLLILIAFSMLTSILSVFSSGAVAAVSETDYNVHLVTHWNFEGNDPYADKAPNGKSADTLIPGGTVEVVNGVANVSNAASKLSASGAAGTDLHSLQNKTVVIKMTAPVVLEKKKNGIILMEKSNAALVGLNADHTLTLRSFAGVGSEHRLHDTKDASSWEEAQNAFRYFVFSYTYDEATGAYIENYYISKTETPASIADWSVLKTIAGTLTDDAQKAAYLTSADSLVFGPNGKDRRFSASYEDIRIYDVAMSLKEVAESVIAPICRGVQFAAGTDSFDIRFVGTVDTLNLRQVGYEITADYVVNGEKKTQDLSQFCSTVYKTVVCGKEEYSAEKDFRSQYFVALAVKGIPQSLLNNNGSIVFTVRPYCITANQEKIMVEAQKITVTYDTANAKYAAVAERI